MGNIISNKPKCVPFLTLWLPHLYLLTNSFPPYFHPLKCYRLEITEVDRAVLSLKTQRHRLEDHRTRVTAQIGRETLVARQLIASEHKDRALLALKKKKLQENTLLKLDAFLLNVESMASKIEL